MTHPENIDLAAIVREAAAGHPNVQVVDFADLGQLPPEVRRAGHMIAQAEGAMSLVVSFHEAATYYLARTIAAAYKQAGGADDEGGVDLDLDTAAGDTADDPDVRQLWEQALPGARRDLVASVAQLLALTRRRRGVAQDEVARMIGQYAGAGHTWRLAEQQLDDAVAAGRDWQSEPMLPDGPHLPALASSPVSVQAERVVTNVGNDARVILVNAAILVAVATVVETNATGNWEALLSVALPEQE